MKAFFLSALFVLGLSFACAHAQACEGHYETRYQTVLVCAAHYEQRFVYAPVYYYGRCVSQGRYVAVFVPPQYAVRPVMVWVADPPRQRYEPEYAGEGYSEPEYVDQRAPREASWTATIRAIFSRR